MVGSTKITAIFLFASLLGVGGTAESAAQSVATYGTKTSRASNDLVSKILLGPNMTDATAVAKALGERSDPFVGDILSRLFSRLSGPESYRYGLLFREVIEYVFLLPTPAPKKIHANSEELTKLIARLQSISDAATKRALLETTRYLPKTASQKPLLAEGFFLERYLRRTGGRFSPERLGEALAFLDACGRHSNEVLRAEAVRLIEQSRNASFVQAARAYLASSE